MKNNTIFSYGTANIDLVNTNKVVLTNFINDINKLDVNYINVANKKADISHDIEKKLGEVFKNKTALKSSFKFVVDLNCDYDEKSIYSYIKRSCNSLRISKIDILKIDLADYRLDLNVLMNTLKSLKEDSLIDEICIYNVKPHILTNTINYFKQYDLQIKYLLVELPIKAYRTFINDYYFLLKMTDITVIYDCVLDNKEIESYPLVEKFIKQTGYSISEFVLLFLNSLQGEKIVNISTSNMKLFSQLCKLKEVKLQPDQLDKFMNIIKGVK